METKEERVKRLRREYKAAIARGADRDELVQYIHLLTNELSFIEPNVLVDP